MNFAPKDVVLLVESKNTKTVSLQNICLSRIKYQPIVLSQDRTGPCLELDLVLTEGQIEEL